MPGPRLIILANTSKPAVNDALLELRPWLQQRGTIVAQPDVRTLSRDNARSLPAADLILVLGGDGTLLAQARHLADVGVPMLGVNFGKLGFLAEFSLEDLHRYWDMVVAGKCRTSRRMMLDIRLYNTALADGWAGDKSEPAVSDVALNDAVITAGPPFRMIELALAIDPPRSNGAATTTFSGDGVIIASPSGSTAYNLAAGGPIVSPDLDAFCITPICPHSLSFRPIVVSSTGVICVRVNEANAGTTLVIDGQLPVKLSVGQQVCVRRFERDLVLVQHPELSHWKMLAQKMHWAARPRSG